VHNASFINTPGTTPTLILSPEESPTTLKRRTIDTNSEESPKTESEVNVDVIQIEPPPGLHSNDKVHCIIIDCSALNYIDTVGVKTLDRLVKDFNDMDVMFYLAECNDNIKNRFNKVKYNQGKRNFLNFTAEKIIHVTVHDAVLHTLKRMEKAADESLQL